MLNNFLSIILSVFYYACFIYLFFIEISYFYFKIIKKDNRFVNIGLFKYLESPIKTLKGDK